jgi:hypothetical protein
MKETTAILFMLLAAGCNALRPHEPPCVGVLSPPGEEPIKLGPGIYRFVLPDRPEYDALLRFEGCGAMWLDTMSRDRDDHVNTLIYPPDSTIAVNARASNGAVLVECVFSQDGTNACLDLLDGGDLSILLNERTYRVDRMVKYRLVRETNGLFRLKEVPNQAPEDTARKLADPQR